MGFHEQALLDQVTWQFNTGRLYSCVKLTDEQIVELQDLLYTAADNDGQQTRFPDFVCDNGWIEHFAVTFGELQEDGIGYKNLQLERTACNNAIRTANNDDLIKHVSTPLTYGAHENFMKSLQRSWDKHISHLQKSDNKYIDKTGVFLIEIDDRGMILHVTDDKGVVHRSNYQMSLDSEFLNFIYEYRNYVKYVIVYSLFCGTSEILAIDAVPEAKNLFANKVSVQFNAVYSIQMNTLYRIKGGKEQVDATQ